MNKHQQSSLSQYYYNSPQKLDDGADVFHVLNKGQNITDKDIKLKFQMTVYCEQEPFSKTLVIRTLCWLELLQNLFYNWRKFIKTS